MSAAAASRALLAVWRPPPAQESLRERYLRLLEQPGALSRPSAGGAAEHLTGSALVVDEEGSQTLLVHHAKGGFWVQPGGHWEPGDADLSATAVREAGEETGIAGWQGPALIGDLHRHELPAAFGACRVHADVMFVLRTVGRPTPRLSAESSAVAWFGLDRLPEGIVADLPARLAALRPGLLGPVAGRG